MRARFSQADLRILRIILSVGLLIGTIPIGVTIIPGPTLPTFTVNVCQPPQMASSVSATPIARPSIAIPELLFRELGEVPPKPSKVAVDLSIAPDTPPPEAVD